MFSLEALFGSFQHIELEKLLESSELKNSVGEKCGENIHENNFILITFE